MYPTLRTNKIILKPFTEDDAGSVFELVRIFDTQNNSTQFANIKSIADAKKLNDETIKSGNEWMIIHKETNQPIGWVVCAKVGAADIRKKVFIHAWIRA